MSGSLAGKTAHGERQVQIAFTAAEHVRENLKAVAERRLISVSAVVRQFIAERLERERTVATRRR